MSSKHIEISSSQSPEMCLNCKQSLSNEHYCPHCGQENANRNISIWTLTQDFLGDYFSFDSKFFTTLVPLAFRPGKVPKEFIEGHRVKHIPPFRILIFSSFIFFTVWGLTFDPNRASDNEFSIDNSSIGSDDVRAFQDSIRVKTNGGLTFDLGLKEDSASSVNEKIADILAHVEGGLSLEHAVDSVTKDNSPFERKLYYQVGKMYSSDKVSIAKYFIGNLSIVLLLIQPFFALLLKLLYIRRSKSYRYIGHLVFSFYFHAWLLVLLTIGLLLQQVWPTIPLLELTVILSLIYLALAIRRYYNQTWLKSLFKTFIIFLLYLCLLVPIAVSISFITSFYFF